MTIDKIAKKSDNKLTMTDIAAPAAATGIGTGLVIKKIKERLSSNIKLNPNSKRVAVVYPGGSSGSGHKVPAAAFIKDLYDRGFSVDTYDTNNYQNTVSNKVITPSYIKEVSRNPLAAMPSETEVDPNVMHGKAKPLWQKLDERETKGKQGKGVLDEVGFELWNRGAGHDRLEKEFKMKANRDGGYHRVFSFFGPTADILKTTSVPVDVVTTDYNINSLIWESEAAGKYHVPNEMSKKRLQKIGVPDNKINVTGNLIVGHKFKNPDKHFIEPQEFTEIRTKNPKAKFVTVSGGGMGINVDQLTRQTAAYYQKKDPNVHVVAIASDNKHVHDSLKATQDAGGLQNVIIKKRVPLGDYMHHAHINIIRPGGSTSAEVLHLGKPVISVNQANIPTDVNKMGAHEHGNIKQLMDSGGAEHFTTTHAEQFEKPKINPFKEFTKFLGFGKSEKGKIQNIHMLDGVLDKVENNYSHYKNNMQQTAETLRAHNPIDNIMNSIVGPGRKPFMKHIDKGLLGAGAVTAAVGAYYLHKNLEKRDKRKPLFKIGAVNNKKNNTWKYLSAPLAIAGAVASTTALGHHFVPGLRGGKTGLKGFGEVMRRIHYDLPANIVSGGRLGKSLDQAVFNVDKTHVMKLTPTDIVNRGLETAKGDTALEKRINSKQNDMRHTLKILGETEDAGRMDNADKMIGITHFPPQQAAMFGYKESKDIHPMVVKHLMANYYNTEKAKAIKKMSEHGIGTLEPTEAYFLTADKSNMRLYEKDLRVNRADAASDAKQSLDQYSKSVLDKNVESEKKFTGKYNQMLNAIYANK